MQHFDEHHTRDKEGRFIGPLPRKANVPPLGESKSQEFCRFTSKERCLRARGAFKNFAEIIHEYFEKDHAEQVPLEELDTPLGEVYYLPMHAIHKEDSTTRKLHIVFDSSAKTTSGTSLNDHLLVGPTVHPPLVDILLRFQNFKLPLTTDVSRMYRAVKLADDQKDIHRFVRRKNPRQ